MIFIGSKTTTGGDGTNTVAGGAGINVAGANDIHCGRVNIRLYDRLLCFPALCI
jgi:hypothetical protein